MNEQARLFDDLDDLLERERNALITGDLAALPGLLVAKEAMLEDYLAAGPPPHHLLRGLLSKMARNQMLLAGTRDGIRNVADRMEELRRVQSSLEVYDGLGQRQRFGLVQDTSVEKLA